MITAQLSALANSLFRDGRWLAWLPLLFGLLIMYVPTYMNLARTAWESDEQAHGPIILAIALWLFSTKVSSLIETVRKPSFILGGLALAFGIACYVIGRSQDVLFLDVGSQFPIVFGLLLLFYGWGGIRALWFPLLFLIFLVPIPGVILDALTSTLKQNVSVWAEGALHLLNYPIARSGVVLTIGQYQLLVADACSGMHSLYSLTAIGLLYVYLMKHTSRMRTVLLLLSIVPIAIAANVIRVIILVLVTYHLGDEAGQGFLHDFAGMLLFVAALGLLFVFDWVLGLFLPDGDTRRTPATKTYRPRATVL